MMSYFFDTNFLFKSFFNTAYPKTEPLQKYINNPHPKYISKNVDYEFSNIYLEFSNQINRFLMEPYFKIKNKDKITVKRYNKITREIEILNFNSSAVSSMIWNLINPQNRPLNGNEFKAFLEDFILDFNSHFHYKYNDLYSRFEIHTRLEKYNDLTDILKHHLHDADLQICLDAHDVCIQNRLDDMVFVTADKAFEKNQELILQNTEIKEIQLIK